MLQDLKTVINGEHLLLGGTPPEWEGRPIGPAFFYKRRYTWDGDIIIGCTYGCSFCYYRWINNTFMSIGRGKRGLRRIGPPEEAARFLESSRLFRPGRKADIVMLAARSDGSMQVEEITDFLRAFKYDNLVFVLHRGYFGQRQLEAWGSDDRVIYSTTITPKPPEADPQSWTPIRPDKQIDGIRFLLEHGVPASRISIMIGPFNAYNVDEGVELIERLADLGIQFVTYRGTSVGAFGVRPDHERLENERFIDRPKENAPEGHEYYKMKNWLNPDVEEKLLRAGERAGVRMYRFTGALYKKEFGVDVAFNRHNRWRRELGQWERVVPERLDSYLRGLGFHPKAIRETEEGYFVELPESETATEDVAMTVGARFRTSVIFNHYRLAPSLSDIQFYAKNRLFWPLPEHWEDVIV